MGGTGFAPNRKAVRVCGDGAWFMSLDYVGLFVAAVAVLLGLLFVFRYQPSSDMSAPEPPPEGLGAAPAPRPEKYCPAPIPTPRARRPAVVPLLMLGAFGFVVFSLLRRAAN
jgi:hypothetical protein